jgi:Cupin-like domain
MDALLRISSWSLIALDYYSRARAGSRIDTWKRGMWTRLDRSAPGSEIIPVRELAAADYSFEALRRLSENFRVPVVVRGLFANVPAVELWQRPEYLIEGGGDEVYFVSTSGRVREQLEAATLEPKNFDKQLALIELPLKEILARMAAGESLYIAALDRIFQRDKRLLRDLAIPQVVPEWWEGKHVPLNPVVVQMFMGMGTDDPANTTGSGLHCARHANLFIQVVGEKHWTLVDPRHSLFVHPSPRYEQPACAASPPYRIEDLPRYEFTIRPGDAFYNPPWMWHQVRNGEGWTIGCATREPRFWATLLNNPVLTLMQEFSEVNSNFAARTAKRPVERFLKSLPLFFLGLGLLQEAVRGYVNPPMRAYVEADDEHPHMLGHLNEAIKGTTKPAP